MNSITKKKHTFEIVEALYQYNSKLFDVNGVDSYNNILEMIQRRNIHVHRRGVVDGAYFSKGNGKSFGLSVGDYAAIDYEYFLNSCEILRGVISNLDDFLQAKKSS